MAKKKVSKAEEEQAVLEKQLYVLQDMHNWIDHVLNGGYELESVYMKARKRNKVLTVEYPKGTGW